MSRNWCFYSGWTLSVMVKNNCSWLICQLWLVKLRGTKLATHQTIGGCNVRAMPIADSLICVKIIKRCWAMIRWNMFKLVVPRSPAIHQLTLYRSLLKWNYWCPFCEFLSVPISHLTISHHFLRSGGFVAEEGEGTGAPHGTMCTLWLLWSCPGCVLSQKLCCFSGICFSKGLL